MQWIDTMNWYVCNELICNELIIICNELICNELVEWMGILMNWCLGFLGVLKQNKWNVDARDQNDKGREQETKKARSQKQKSEENEKQNKTG